MNLRIGLDLDGVVSNFGAAVKERLNEKFGYTFDPSEEWDHWDAIEESIKPEHWKWLWNKNIDEHFFYKHIKPYEGAQGFVRDLNKIGDVIVLTSRPKGARRDTIDWWFLWDFPAIAGFNFFANGNEKSLVQVDAMIEDNWNYARAFKDGSPWYTKVVLMDRLYNRREHEEDWYVRARDYGEVLAALSGTNVVRGGYNWSL